MAKPIELVLLPHRLHTVRPVSVCRLYHPISALKLAQNSRSSSIFYVFRRITSFDILAQRSIFCLMSRGVWLICNTWLSLSQTTATIVRQNYTHYFCFYLTFVLFVYSCLSVCLSPTVSVFMGFNLKQSNTLMDWILSPAVIWSDEIEKLTNACTHVSLATT